MSQFNQSIIGVILEISGMLTNFSFSYSFGVLALTILLLTWGLYRLRKAENLRIEKAKEQDVFEAVKTEGIDEDAETITRRAAMHSIENRFDFIRKIFVPGVLVTSGLLLLIPHLPVIPAAYVSLFAGAIAVILGIASKPLIENLIAGVVITMAQPIRVNDTIRLDGRYGTVERINFLYTTVKVWNWNRWVVPNHRLLQKEIENLSRGDDAEWAYIEFYVAPSSDMERVKYLAKKSMQCRYLNNTEPPSFWVMNMEKDAIKCWVAGWANNAAEAWALKSAARYNLVLALKEEGIQMQQASGQIKIDPGLEFFNKN